MGRSVILIFLGVFGISIAGVAGEISPDRIEVRGGVVLLGNIASVGDGVLHVQTSYAGALAVNLKEIEQVVLSAPKELGLPPGIPVSQPGSATPVSSTKNEPARRSQPAQSGLLGGWIVDSGLNLNGNSGNTERFDLTLTIEAELEREVDRLKLYGRYGYGVNRGVRSANEIIGGAQYNNYVFNRLGLFVRQEVEQDDFEGIRFRSTSASGLIFKFKDDKRLRLEARTGLSYRFEDYTDDGADDLPGMDLGLDVNWQFVQWARFKGTYSFLPSMRDFGDFIFEQDSGLNLPLDESEHWKLRFGVQTQFNNQPDFGREKLDTRYYARLIASWQ